MFDFTDYPLNSKFFDPANKNVIAKKTQKIDKIDKKDKIDEIDKEFMRLIKD